MMNKCSECGRNLNKNLHNWSEVMAGISVLIVILPIVYALYPNSPISIIISLFGLASLFIWCVIHLITEMRWN